jgi:hypothetical protein
MNEAVVKLLARIENARSQLAAAKLPDKAVSYCIAGLERMERVLARAPRVAILGEVNSGKTSVADLLLGAGLLPTSVVANTQVPVLIRYADSLALFAVTQDGRQRLTDYGPDDLPSGLELRSIEIGVPSDRLLNFQILDTPSLADVAEVVGDAEILIWCTVATRAWTESERAAWSALPPRCWRNGLLVATHIDSLQDASEMTKIEQRLRAVTAPMFRDVLLVSAADASEHGGADDGLSSDGGTNALIAHIEAMADEITERRALKAEKIIRRLARLTFHHLATAQLKTEAANQLKDWEARSSNLLDDLERGTASLASVIESLLRGFADAVEQARPGTVRRQSSSREVATSGGGGAVGWPLRAAAGQRFARLLAADLTALLRIELAHWGLRDPAKDIDYRMARSVLLSLADLGGAFDALGQILLSSRSRVASSAAGIEPKRYGGTGLLH